MDITQEEKQGVKVIKILGSLDTNTAPDANAQLEKVVKDGANQILLDFTELDYISSAGIRVLLHISKELLGKGSMGIFKANKQVREVFDMTGLTNLVFNLYESEDSALASINPE